MSDINIIESALSFFKSYLENRVKINNSISNEQTIKIGVPQGQHYLFNIQLNDIKLLKLNNNIVCYADDTVLICTRATWENIIKNIEDNLLAIKNWLRDKNLLLNFDESAIILYSRARTHYAYHGKNKNP